MKRKFLLYVAVLLTACLTLQAQEVKSEKSSLRISNMPVTVVEEIPDNDPPSVEFITPQIYLGTRFYTDKKELDIIGKAVDSSGISFLSINGELRQLNEKGIFTSRLMLEPGDNGCRLITMDNKENILEIAFIVNYTPLVVTLAEKIISKATYYGLIIGIDIYRDSHITNLDNPVRDALKLRSTLINNYHFKEENVELLTNATRADIIRSLDRLGDIITPEDNLLIFYAGHGTWDSDANNGYWLPSDAQNNEKTNWFRNSTLADYLKEINSKHTLLISDACFGGSILKMRSAFGNSEKVFEKLYALPSRKAMTSGTLTKVPDRSSFTRFLIQRLEENQELYLSSEQLFTSFRHAVSANSNALPQYGEIDNVGDQGGDFIFLKRTKY